MNCLIRRLLFSFWIFNYEFRGGIDFMVVKDCLVENAQLLEELSSIMIKNNRIDPELYTKHNVKRGLRNNDGTGVVPASKAAGIGITPVATLNGTFEKEVRRRCERGGRVRGLELLVLVPAGFLTPLPKVMRFAFLVSALVSFLLLGVLSTFPASNEWRSRGR